MMHMVSCVPHDFFGHTANIHAGTAQGTRFHDTCPFAIFCSSLGVCEAAAPTAEDQQVIFLDQLFLQISRTLNASGEGRLV